MTKRVTPVTCQNSEGAAHQLRQLGEAAWGGHVSPLILHYPVSNVHDFLGDLMMFLQ